MIETSKFVDVVLPLGIKQRYFVQGYLYCLHYTLCLMQLSVACNLIPMGDTDVNLAVNYKSEMMLDNGLCILM